MLNCCLIPAILSINTLWLSTLQAIVPKALIGIPPGSPGAGILMAFLVPHFTVISFVLTKSTSALIPELNPNLNPFNVDRKGTI